MMSTTDIAGMVKEAAEYGAIRDRRSRSTRVDVPTDEELAETRQDLKIVLRELAKGQKTSAAAE